MAVANSRPVDVTIMPMRWPPRGTPVSVAPRLGGHLVDAERLLPLDGAGVEVVGGDLRPAALHDVREAEAVAGVVARLRRVDALGIRRAARPEAGPGPDVEAARRAAGRDDRAVGRRRRRVAPDRPRPDRPPVRVRLRRRRGRVGDEVPERAHRLVVGRRERRHVAAADEHDLAEVLELHARAEAERASAPSAMPARSAPWQAWQCLRVERRGRAVPARRCARPPPGGPRFGGVSDSL